jgi:hypothetical protein
MGRADGNKFILLFQHSESRKRLGRSLRLLWWVTDVWQNVLTLHFHQGAVGIRNLYMTSKSYLRAWTWPPPKSERGFSWIMYSHQTPPQNRSSLFWPAISVLLAIQHSLQLSISIYLTTQTIFYFSFSSYTTQDVVTITLNAVFRYDTSHRPSFLAASLRSFVRWRLNL